MGKALKIILIIAIIVVLLIVAFAIFTYYQIRQIYNLAENSELKQDLADLTKGNCSKLKILEPKINQMQASLKTVCINPVVRILSHKIQVYGTDICIEIKNPENKIQQIITQARTGCSRMTN